MGTGNRFEFVEVTLSRKVLLPPAVIWPVIGGFFDLGKWLDVECVGMCGTGEVGSVRRIGNAIVETLVARGPWSYTYGQIEGPMAARYYHGTVACEYSAEGGSIIRYSLVFDAADMTEPACNAERERLKSRFQTALDSMVEALA